MFLVIQAQQGPQFKLPKGPAASWRDAVITPLIGSGSEEPLLPRAPPLNWGLEPGPPLCKVGFCPGKGRMKWGVERCSLLLIGVPSMSECWPAQSLGMPKEGGGRPSQSTHVLLPSSQSKPPSGPGAGKMSQSTANDEGATFEHLWSSL